MSTLSNPHLVIASSLSLGDETSNFPVTDPTCRPPLAPVQLEDIIHNNSDN